MKHKKIKATKVILAALGLCLSSALVAQDIPAGAWAGKWIASNSRSKFPGAPPKLDQVTIEDDGTAAIHVVNADGKTADWSYKPQLNQAVQIQGRDNTTVKIVKVNDHRIDQIWNANGKMTRSHSTLSKDGKTQTFYGAPGTNAQGKAFREVVVYEKQ
jgi:hypothetical protein